MAFVVSELLSASTGETLLSRNVAALTAELERLKRIDPTLNAEGLLPAMLGAIHEGGMCVTDCDGHILSAWLPLEIQARFGLNTPELVGQGLRDFLPQSVFLDRLALIRRAITQGETIRHEFFAEFPGGSFWIEASVSPLFTAGAAHYVLTFFRDITRRKAAEASRDESEARYRGIVENSLDAIMLTRPDGVIEYMSPATLQVLGWPPEELIGTRPSIIHPADSERTREMLRQALEGGRGSAYEYRILTRDDQVRWVSHSWAPILHGDQVHMVVSVVRDITERKRLEHELRQAERLATVGQTIADIAHQLKTICLNIRGSASMFDKALAENRTESMRALWGVFQRSSDRLATLAIEMLEYAALETLQPRRLDLNQLLTDLRQECLGKAGWGAVELRLRLDPRLPAIGTDPVKLGEVFMNLISNAIDACQEQTAGIVAIETQWDEAARRVRVAVIDNGSGIPREALPRIFDPFFTTKGAKGTGLGLAIVQKAVQLHGGEIAVDSVPGRTALTVTLPAEPPVQQ